MEAVVKLGSCSREEWKGKIRYDPGELTLQL
jgi:hypothetical protein